MREASWLTNAIGSISFGDSLKFYKPALGERIMPLVGHNLRFAGPYDPYLSQRVPLMLNCGLFGLMAHFPRQ